MNNRKILIIILLLAVVAVLVSAAMKKTSLFFNGNKTSLHYEEKLKDTFQFPLSVYTNSITTEH